MRRSTRGLSLASALSLAPLVLTPFALPAAAEEQAVARSTQEVCPSGSVPEDGFSDVSSDSTHEAAVDCVVWWQIARGTTSGYAPKVGVSRAAMSTFIASTIESASGALPAAPDDAFSDDNGGTHELRTNQLAAVGIVSGTGGGRYSPEQTVTRGQMAKFIALSAEYLAEQPLPPGGNRFNDDDGTPFESYIDQIAEAGVTSGSADGRYQASVTVTREQMGSFLARTLDLLVEKGHPAEAAPLRTSPYTAASIDSACPQGEIADAGYNDTADEPYRDAIDCATHWQVMRGAAADTFAPRTLVSRGQAASYAARLFDALGGTRPESIPDAYDDDNGSTHEASANLLAAIGAAPVDQNRWFIPQSMITVHELNGFLDGVYAARSDGQHPFTSSTKDRPVLRAEMAAELAAYLSTGVDAGYTSVP